MADLSTEDRAAVWCCCMSRLEPVARVDSITKDEYRSAVNTLDTWIGTTALPSAAMLLPSNVRDALTDKELAQLLAAVLCKRVDKGVF